MQFIASAMVVIGPASYGGDLYGDWANGSDTAER